MKPMNPSQSSYQNPGGVLRQAQSVFKALNGAVQDAQPISEDASGVYNSFEQDNGSGVMLRIGATGSTETLKWAASNTPLIINHGLQRKPIGFTVRDIDKASIVYRTAPPTVDTISLACNDATTNVTVYIE